MSEIVHTLVIDVPLSGRRNEIKDLWTFSKDVYLGAVGLLRGIDTMRLVLRHWQLRVPVNGAGNAMLISRARVKYPFLFLASQETNPLLYREF